MPGKLAYPAIPLSRNWPSHVKSAVLHVISLAQFAIAYSRGWVVDSVNTRVRLKAELDRALHDNALLREELRIKDLRMTRIPPHRRPLYPPTERMAILQVKAARQWSLEQTANAFLVTSATSIFFHLFNDLHDTGRRCVSYYRIRPHLSSFTSTIMWEPSPVAQAVKSR